MAPYSLITAVILGIVEGITEFLPVSSTGHLILVGRWLGVVGDRANAFEIFIQLGAVLAVVWDFRRSLAARVRALPADPDSRRLLGGVLLAFLPAAAAGWLFHDLIEEHLFSEGPIALAMVAGGILILIVEARRPRTRIENLEGVGWARALAVGCAQIVSLFPGFSRSAATILGGLLVGMSRPAATEFSFYLAIPTLTAAALYSLLKAWPELDGADAPFFLIGLVVSFLTAAVVVRSFLAYVRTRTFRPFAWYRIALGVLILALVLTRLDQR